MGSPDAANSDPRMPPGQFWNVETESGEQEIWVRQFDNGWRFTRIQSGDEEFVVPASGELVEQTRILAILGNCASCGSAGPWPTKFLYCPGCGARLDGRHELLAWRTSSTETLPPHPKSGSQARDDGESPLPLDDESAEITSELIDLYKQVLTNPDLASEFLKRKAFGLEWSGDGLAASNEEFELAPFWAAPLSESETRCAIFPGLGFYIHQVSYNYGSREATAAFHKLFKTIRGDGFLKVPAHVQFDADGVSILDKGLIELP